MTGSGGIIQDAVLTALWCDSYLVAGTPLHRNPCPNHMLLTYMVTQPLWRPFRWGELTYIKAWINDNMRDVEWVYNHTNPIFSGRLTKLPLKLG